LALTYGDADRLVSMEHKIDSGSLVKIAENSYNELGELPKNQLVVATNEL